MNIGWIGLGSVGLPRSVLATSAGTVTAYDLRIAEMDLAPGIIRAGSAAAAVQDADVTLVWVFDDAQLRDLLDGPQGIREALRPGSVLCVFTTGEPEVIVHLAQSLRGRVHVLDTCFSSTQADAGVLTLLVGGEADAIALARPVLETFSRSVVHCGASGSGRTFKLLNNFMYFSNLMVALDGLRIAGELGLDPELCANVLRACSASSDVLNSIVRRGRDDLLAYSGRYMTKDVALVRAELARRGIDCGLLGRVTAEPLPADASASG